MILTVPLTRGDDAVAVCRRLIQMVRIFNTGVSLAVPHMKQKRKKKTKRQKRSFSLCILLQFSFFFLRIAVLCSNCLQENIPEYLEKSIILGVQKVLQEDNTEHALLEEFEASTLGFLCLPGLPL